MTMHDYVWLYITIMSMFDYIKLWLTMNDYVQLCTDDYVLLGMTM